MLTLGVHRNPFAFLLGTTPLFENVFLSSWFCSIDFKYIFNGLNLRMLFHSIIIVFIYRKRPYKRQKVYIIIC